MSNNFTGFDMITAVLIGFVIGVIIGIVVACKAVDKYDKFCPVCGHQYKTEAEYCSYDGSELREVK